MFNVVELSSTNAEAARNLSKRKECGTSTGTVHGLGTVSIHIQKLVMLPEKKLAQILWT